jgi:hypothetical protein
MINMLNDLDQLQLALLRRKNWLRNFDGSRIGNDSKEIIPER